MATAAKKSVKAAEKTFSEGDWIVFLEEDSRGVIKQDTPYQIVGLDKDKKGKTQYLFNVENPDFDPKSPVDEDTNPQVFLVEAYASEIDATEAPAEDETVEEEVEVETEVEEVQAKPVAKAKPAAKVAPAAKAASAKGKPAAVAAKGKATTKPTKAKPEARGKVGRPAKTEEEREAEDKYQALDQEDAEITTLVNESEDIFQLAEDMINDMASSEYKLGGILYHIRLSKSYKELDSKYAENKGFETFVNDRFPGLGYRKTMHLIKVYFHFNKHGIAADKVQELGWTKAARIASVLDRFDDADADDLLKLAEENTVADLEEAIKEGYATVGAQAGERKRRVVFKFKLFEDKAALVSDVIKGLVAAKEVKDESEAFEKIVTEWAIDHGMVATKPAATKSTTLKMNTSVTKKAVVSATA